MAITITITIWKHCGKPERGVSWVFIGADYILATPPHPALLTGLVRLSRELRNWTISFISAINIIIIGIHCHFGGILRCQPIVAMSFPWKYMCFYVVDSLNQRDLGRGGWLRDPSGSDGGSPAEQITTDLTINWFTHLQGGRKIFIFHLDF